MASVVGAFQQLGLSQPQGIGQPNAPMDQQMAAAQAAMRGQNPSPMGSQSMNDQSLIPPAAQEAQPANSDQGTPTTMDQMMAQNQQQGA